MRLIWVSGLGTGIFIVRLPNDGLKLALRFVVVFRSLYSATIELKMAVCLLVPLSVSTCGGGLVSIVDRVITSFYFLNVDSYFRLQINNFLVLIEL